ncbi:MAG TPA: LptA/OstA family protein, partial [Methylomirabilota bacterium]|nr:LptA/OstA family protein [Methylomirabilota bacterium]
MRNLRAICLLICLLKAATFARGQEAQPVWEIQGTTETSGFEVDLNAGTAVYTGGVRIEYGGAVLTAREARVNRATGDVIAEGDVKLLYEGVLWTSEHVRYNFKTRYIEAEKFKTGRAPYFVEGEGLSYDLNTGTYTATNALITSDDYGDPAQKIRARSITFVPDDYVEARGAR